MRYLDRIIKIFLAVAMLFATVLLFTNVVLRYFFKSAIFWTEEMLRYLMVWITFIGVSMCVKEDSNISVDILSTFLKGKSKKVLFIILHTIGIVFGAYMLYISTRYVIQTHHMGQVSPTIGHVPMYIIYLCFPIGFFLYVLQSFIKLINIFKGKATNEGLYEKGGTSC